MVEVGAGHPIGAQGGIWRTFLYYVAPLVAWMGLIFFLSAQPATQYSRLGELLDFIPMLSSLVHGALYFVLAALLIRLLVRLRTPRTPKARVLIAIIPVLLAVLYGLSDELHQGYVEGRDSSVADIIADALGAGCAAFVSYVVPKWRGGATRTE